MSGIWPYVAALLPTILVAIFFYFIIKSMLEGDRRERIAQKQFEAEQDARLEEGAERPASDGARVTASDRATVTPGSVADAAQGTTTTGDSSPETHSI